METWGAGGFENDDAADWQLVLLETSDESAIEEGLRSVAEATEDQYVEAPECQIAIAAAEVVAAVKGSPSSSLPQDVAEWARKRRGISTDALALARTAVDRVARKSELKDLWEESSPDEWRSRAQ